MLQRSKSFQSSKPQDFLHQISLEDDQLSMIEQMKKSIKKKGINATKSPRYKIVNAKALANYNEGNQDLSSWINLNYSEYKPIQIPSNDKAQLYNTRVITNNLNAKKLYQSFIGRQKWQQERFLSMSELCHRYTFINNQGNYNRYCRSQLQLSDIQNPIKFQHANKIQIKWDKQQDFLVSRHKTKLKSMKKSKEIIKLPQVTKKQQISQDTNDALDVSPYMDKILKVINKSTQKRLNQPQILTQKSKSKSNQKEKEKLHKNYSQQKQKINNIRLLKLGHIINWKKTHERNIIESKKKQQLVSERKVNKKQAKILQQCLILNKK